MAGIGNFHEIDLASCAVDGVHEIRGATDASGLRFGIVVSRFNRRLTEALVKDAIAALSEHGADPSCIHVTWVPGAFEIPPILEQLARAGRYDALIALGAVLQGETPHAQAIAHSVSSSVTLVSRQYGLPVIDGVVVALTEEMAESRCLSGPGSRGTYAARAAVEMAHVMARLPELGRDPDARPEPGTGR